MDLFFEFVPFASCLKVKTKSSKALRAGLPEQCGIRYSSTRGASVDKGLADKQQKQASKMSNQQTTAKGKLINTCKKLCLNELIKRNPGRLGLPFLGSSWRRTFSKGFKDHSATFTTSLFIGVGHDP